MTGRWNNGQSDFNCYGGMTCEYQVKVKSWERLFILMSFLLDAQHNLLFSNSYLTQLPVFYLLPTVAFFKDLQHCTTKLNISSAKIKNIWIVSYEMIERYRPLLVYLRLSICNVNQMAMAFRHATITSTVELNWIRITHLLMPNIEVRYAFLLISFGNSGFWRVFIKLILDWWLMRSKAQLGL